MSFDSVEEDVPSFTRRVGDTVQQGSNSTVVILGTDRARKGPATVSDGLGHVNAPGKGKGTGTYHVIAGRSGENPDFERDMSFLYLSMKTEADKNLGTSGVEGDSGPTSAAIMKSDAVRIVARKSLKIVIEGTQNYMHMDADKCTIRLAGVFITLADGKVVVDGEIELGKGATERLVKGDAFKELYMSHSHVCAVGSSGPPVVPMVDELHLSSRTARVL